MYTLFRKNQLGKLLTEMKKTFPEYNYFPDTYIMPSDKLALNRDFQKKKDQVFIVKPAAQSQGNGIFITNKIQDIPNEPLVV